MENRRRLPPARRTEIALKLANPLITKFELLSDTSADLLMCALYVRIFMSEQQQQAGSELLRQALTKKAAVGGLRPAVNTVPPTVNQAELPGTASNANSQSATEFSASTPENPQ
jgi:hypothetical protein